MKLWESFLGRRTPPGGEARFGFQDWVDLFSYNGNSYPLLNTTWGNDVDEESMIRTATAAYHNNGPVFALVMARMQVFSQARFQWTRFKSGKPTELFGSSELSILERPWPGGTTGDLLARMEVDVSQAGNSYTRRVRRGVGPTKVDRLNRLRPEWVTIVMGSEEDADHPAEAGDTELLGYVYKPGGLKGDRMIFLLPEQVAHYAPIPDPDNNFLGLSWITSVLTEAAADDGMTLHKRKFMTNAATPNLSIKFDPSMTIDQVREFKALMEEEHKGAFNAYKTLFLGGGADATVIGKDFKELDFSATQGKGESRLASAAGVPPSWVGFSEGLQGSSLNAGNFGAARRRFGDGTMQHLWSNAATSLETIVTQPTGASLWFDTSGMPFLREDAKDAADIQSREAITIRQLVESGFTAESVIAAVENSDWNLLAHTGLTSVQLQPPVDPNAAPPTDAPNQVPPPGGATPK